MEALTGELGRGATLSLFFFEAMCSAGTLAMALSGVGTRFAEFVSTGIAKA